MRLPLRHRPPSSDAAAATCEHLRRLAEASIGLPLGPAAARVASARSRGRHGRALEWHLGLDPDAGEARLDWEDRIEIKLVSVWGRGSGGDAGVGCDKVKVCDLAVDPWRKLGNVLWVFADRLTRVVVATCVWRLAGGARDRLAASWDVDPHFEHPLLFVEARDDAPAYYIAARFFVEEGLLPRPGRGIFPFDARAWQRARATHGRDPLLTVVERDADHGACPRCGAPMRWDPGRLSAARWAIAHHGPARDPEAPSAAACMLAAHVAVEAAHVGRGAACDEAERRAAVEARVSAQRVWRLSDRVAEPEDHEH